MTDPIKPLPAALLDMDFSEIEKRIAAQMSIICGIPTFTGGGPVGTPTGRVNTVGPEFQHLKRVIDE